MMAGRRRLRRTGRSSGRRAIEALGVFVLLIAVALVAAVLDNRSMRELSGTPSIIDGDTLTFQGERLRLAGIDAPELSQTCRRNGVAYDCGQEAKRALANLATGNQTVCKGNEEDRYGRLLVRCISAATDLNAAMVRAGWAVSYGDYAREEAMARGAGAGIWAGSFEQPERWRASRGGVAEIGPAGVWWRLVNRIRNMLGSQTDGEDK